MFRYRCSFILFQDLSWLVNSEATSHIMHHHESFKDFYKHPSQIIIGDSTTTILIQRSRHKRYPHLLYIA
eukprot:c3412_g1_i1 orf=333-542(+)